MAVVKSILEATMTRCLVVTLAMGIVMLVLAWFMPEELWQEIAPTKILLFLGLIFSCVGAFGLIVQGRH